MISYTNLKNCKDMETYFFKEINDFIIVCKNENIFQIERLNYKKDSNSINYCYLISFKIKYCNSLDMYSLIYNNSINDYNIISDYNFTNAPNDCSINMTRFDKLIENLEISTNENEEKNEENLENLISSIFTENIYNSTLIENYNTNKNNLSLDIKEDDFQKIIEGLKREICQI